MLIPWPLVVSVLAAAAVGAVVVRAHGQRVGMIGDVVLSVGVPALIAARLAVLVRDAVLTGGFGPVASWPNITAGLSLPVALVVALLAGARVVRRRPPAPAVDLVVTVTAAWAGMITFAALSVVRGDALGMAAPPPLGIPWPGLDGTFVPVAPLEAAVLGLALWWTRRRDADAVGMGARLLATLTLLHLVGGMLRPSLATVDRDLDGLLGIAALMLALAAVRQVAPRRLTAGAAAGTLVLGLLTVATLREAPARATADVAGPTPGLATGSLHGAMVTGHDPTEVPAWDGDQLAAFAREAGQPVVVNLWASWCPPCHAEAPAVARAARALEGQVTFLGVLVDDEPGPAQSFVERYDLPFPTVVDDGITAAVGSPGLPTTVVIGPDGVVLQRAVGGVDGRSLAAMLERASG